MKEYILTFTEKADSQLNEIYDCALAYHRGYFTEEFKMWNYELHQYLRSSAFLRCRDSVGELSLGRIGVLSYYIRYVHGINVITITEFHFRYVPFMRTHRLLSMKHRYDEMVSRINAMVENTLRRKTILEHNNTNTQYKTNQRNRLTESDLRRIISECVHKSLKRCLKNSVLNENTKLRSKPKRIIRLTESDLVNIVKQCLFESTIHTPLLTESAQDKRVQKFLKSKGYSDYNKRMEIIGKTKHDIPNIRLDNDKFLLGCLRMFFDGQLRDEPSYRNVDNALKQIHADGHTDEFDENLNGKTPDDLYNMFRETIKQNAAKDRERSAKRVFDSGSNYKIIPINSFEEAEPYGQYTSWCVTHGQNAFDTYTTYGNRFYFCLRNDFQNVPKDDENAPINEWGLSMIAVNVDTDGNLTRVTTRYNHDYNGENNPQLETPKQLENVLNVPFYQTFKPYTRQELLDMGVVPFDMVQELLDSGKKPHEIFRCVGHFDNGYAMVKLNGKWNFINGEGRLVSPTWFDDVENFDNGYARVRLNGKWNLINEEGRLISLTWADYFEYFHNGYVKVELDDKYNFINREGRLVSPTWFDVVGDFYNDCAKVELNGKWNLINRECKLVSPTWFDNVEYFGCNDYAIVKLNGKWNLINREGRLVSPTWFDYCESLGNGYTKVKLNDKYNFINGDGRLLSPTWVRP